MNDNAFKKLLTEFRRLSEAQQIDRIGDMIDDAVDRDAVEQLASLVMEAQRLAEQIVDKSTGTEAYYQLGNALSAIHRIKTQGTSTVFAWNQPEIRHAIFAYRRAVTQSAELTNSTMASRHLQSLTNLANSLSHVGRALDAIEHYDRAISIYPVFAMAIGNRAWAIDAFSNCLYDDGHRVLGHRMALDGYNMSLANWRMLEPHAKHGIEQRRKALLARYNSAFAGPVDWPAKAIGKSKAEREYRKWCFVNRLFVNDTADFLPAAVAATDATSLPSIVRPIDKPQQFFGLFNLMKQEFITARWLCFDGMVNAKPHFSDRESLIYDTNDTAIHSYAMEKVRIGTRAAFSVLDKIGYFVSLYWNLGHDPKRLSFRNVWYSALETKKGINPSLEKTDNNALRGLYWLSLDFNDTDLQEVLEEDSQGLQELRNYMEHRFVKVIELECLANPAVTGDPEVVMKVERSNFLAKSLSILKLVRRAMIYLSCAVFIEEARRTQKRGKVPIGQLSVNPSRRR